MNHALEDGAIGGLTGLTDGLNLVARVGTNAAINAVGEAYKEEVSYMNSGCPKEFNATRITFAAVGGAFGDLGGDLIGHALASSATALSHVVQESSAILEMLFESNISGAISLTPAAIERTTQ